MEDSPMNLSTPNILPTPAHLVELERLGDAIAELSAHLDAATARLLDLIREFDARGGWGNGFASCAAWLTWRIGLDPGAPASTSALRGPSAPCRYWLRPPPVASCRTRKSGR